MGKESSKVLNNRLIKPKWNFCTDLKLGNSGGDDDYRTSWVIVVRGPNSVIDMD